MCCAVPSRSLRAAGHEGDSLRAAGMKPRILFVTTDLAAGGAQMMLVKLLSRLYGRRVEAEVVSLLPPGPLSKEIEALGVPLWHLGLDTPWRLPQAAVSLARITLRFRPDVIQGWMYHGNLAAWWARTVAARRARLFWGIRQSFYDFEGEKPLTRWMIWLGARLSPRAAAILYNSQTARDQHESAGYSAVHSRVIDNGFDTERFRPDRESYRSVRKELGLAPKAILIGLVARYHPMKGHAVFLAAARQLAARRPDVHFLLVGRDITPDHPLFRDATIDPHLRGRLHLLAERRDIPRLTAALDIASSASSWGEAFSNAIGEAMSCGVPCVSTAVGDSPRIIDDTGFIVPVGDAAALANAWARLLALPSTEWQALGERARLRVIEHFSLDHIAARYAALYYGESL